MQLKSVLYKRIKKKFNWKENKRRKVLNLFRDKNGIEIGGPSHIFQSILPVYPIVNNLDGCNFSKKTFWEGNIQDGKTYNYYPNKTGYQYISEASDLKEIPSNKYDFLLSSHCLEHCANPLKVIGEWKRIVRSNSYLLLILPDGRYTFDHNRKVTDFDHLLEDFRNNIDETDLTHLEEILQLHDLTLDPLAGTPGEFKQRSLQNYHNRCLHHHVFDFTLLEKIFDFHKIRLCYKTFIKPYHQVVIGIKQ